MRTYFPSSVVCNAQVHDCTGLFLRYQALLQKNLLFLAAIADAQPADAVHPQVGSLLTCFLDFIAITSTYYLCILSMTLSSPHRFCLQMMPQGVVPRTGRPFHATATATATTYVPS